MKNIFALVDDGNVPVEEYLEGQRLVLEYAASHPDGIGCIAIDRARAGQGTSSC